MIIAEKESQHNNRVFIPETHSETVEGT